jgi:hypothetical protein
MNNSRELEVIDIVSSEGNVAVPIEKQPSALKNALPPYETPLFKANMNH